MARVIVAHADPAVLASLQDLLSNLGHECVCSTEPIGTLQLAVASPPDLIVLSDGLPQMSGATLLELTRCLLGTRCPPIVYVPSASGERLVAELSAALPSAFVCGDRNGRSRSAA